MPRSLLEYRSKALTPASTSNSHLRMLAVRCHATDLKGLYVCKPFETTTEFETAFARLRPLELARKSMCIYPRVSCRSYSVDIAKAS